MTRTTTKTTPAAPRARRRGTTPGSALAALLLLALAQGACTTAPVSEAAGRVVVTRTETRTDWATPEAIAAAEAARQAALRPRDAARPAAGSAPRATEPAPRPQAAAGPTISTAASAPSATSTAAPAQATTPTAAAAAPVAAAPPNAPAATNAAASPIPATAPTATPDAATTAADRLVFFDFDRADIQDRFRPLLERHARWLGGDPARRLRIEGHADERGSAEYNLALGQRRAQAVAGALAVLGAGAAQLETVSFGSTRPAVAASDEAAWAQNRRAELRPAPSR
jgi:peptidoglycan-associated lipoprotein